MVEHEQADSSNEEGRLRLAVQMAVQVIEGCDFASVTLVNGESVAAQAASDPVAERADRLQRELGEGPSPDCLHYCQTVVTQDLGSERRWHRWSPQARDLGLASVASLWLHAEDSSYGSLNLYSGKPFRFNSGGLASAQTLATRVGAAIAAGRESDQLNAVGSRTVIGQAQGILMERLGIEAEEAFAFLRRASQHSDTGVAQVAVDLVRTRLLPPVPPAD